MDTLPAGVRPANPAYAINGDPQFVLPPCPTSVSPDLAAIIADYRAGFASGATAADDGAVEKANALWNGAAGAVQIYQPRSIADLAAKLITAIHFRDPERKGAELAISVPEAPLDRQAVEIELGCIDWLIGQVAAHEAPTPAWDAAVKTYEQLTAIVEKTRPSDDEDRFDQLASAQGSAIEALIHTPAPDLKALTAKLRIADAGGYQHLIAPIAADGERLAAIHVVETVENPALAQAFANYRDAHSDLRVAIEDLSDKAAEPFYARMDPVDVIMKTTAAQTPAGVLMKLKRAFASWSEDAWSDDAILDKRPAAFETGVQQSGLYVEMMWRAIEDLERIVAKGGANG